MHREVEDIKEIMIGEMGRYTGVVLVSDEKHEEIHGAVAGDPRKIVDMLVTSAENNDILKVIMLKTAEALLEDDEDDEDECEHCGCKH